MVGSYCKINEDCASGRLYADLEFIDERDGSYYVLEAKVPYTSDRFNTRHKLLGQLLAECNKELTFQSREEGQSASKFNISESRAANTDKISYGALFIWESYDELGSLSADLKTPPHSKINGTLEYAAYFGKIKNAFDKFGKDFSVDSIFILKATELSLYYISWGDFAGRTENELLERMTLFARG